MTVVTNSFEGGTNGTTITAGNSGGASGNPFDSVSVGSGGTLSFSNAQAALGTLSALAQTTTAAATYAAWGASIGTPAQVWFRIYLYFGTLPSATTRFFTVSNGGGTGCARFAITTAGKILAADGAGSTITTSTLAIPTAQWFRVEGFATLSASVGQTEVKLFLLPENTTADETDTSAANQNTLGSPTLYAFGPDAGTANQGPYYMDYVGLSSTGYLGPGFFLYQGQFPVYYLDYIDSTTNRTLSAVPGNAYAMYAVSSRAGLTVPPPDGRWLGE